VTCELERVSAMPSCITRDAAVHAADATRRPIGSLHESRVVGTGLRPTRPRFSRKHARIALHARGQRAGRTADPTAYVRAFAGCARRSHGIR
jgi:hypothetical protein